MVANLNKSPDDNGYKPVVPLFTSRGQLSDRQLEMLKTAFCLVLATWMSAALMAIVYSKEIAEFIVERSQ